MLGDMAKIDLPYVKASMSKGRLYTYYRRGGRQERIKGSPGGPEWLAEYTRIHGAHEGRPAAAQPRNKTWAALIAEYRGAPEYLTLAARTQRDYGRHLNRIVERNGRKTVAGMTRPDLLRIRDKAATAYGPRQADYLMSVFVLLLSFSIDRGYRKDHPGLRIKKVFKPVGHRPWMDDEIAAFRKTHALGAWERTAFEIVLNTGQRRGDIPAMTWRQIADGCVNLRQNKTGDWLSVPMHHRLVEALAAWPRTGVAILIGDKAKPVGVERFARRMSDAYSAAELVGVTTHGLRYTTATILKELGCGADLRRAVLGHATIAMAEKYAKQKRDARAAISRMEAGEVSNPADGVSNRSGGRGITH